MIFLFIVIVMGLLTATLNYYKGYKVNDHILKSIEKYMYKTVITIRGNYTWNQEKIIDL